MQPFLATYQPALSDDYRFVRDFGGLPTDVVEIVVRSIPQFERTSLLSLALVNKTAYFLTRSQRDFLAARKDRFSIRLHSATIRNARQLQHMLHLVGNPGSRLCTAEKHALICHWLDADLKPGQVLRLLDAALSLPEPEPEKGDVLWRLFRSRDKWVAQKFTATVMPALEQAADCLPEGEKAGFALACRLAGLIWDYPRACHMDYTEPHANALAVKPVHEQQHDAKPRLDPLFESLRRDVEQALAQARAWQFPALNMVLDILKIYCSPYFFRQLEALFIEFIHATAAWPAAPRLPIFKTLTDFAHAYGCGAAFANCMAKELLLLGGSIEASSAQNDVHQLQLLDQLHTVCKHFRHMHQDLDCPETVAALEGMQKRIATRLLEFLLAAPAQVLRDVANGIDELMRSLYGWDFVLPQWQDGFKALCVANRKAHGVSYGNLENLKGLRPFADPCRAVEEARRSILALLETKDESIGSDNEVATWRLFIRVMANQPNWNTLPRYQSSETLALDHVAELLTRQNTMTHEAWVEIMATTIEQLEHSASLHAAVRDALSHAGTIAPAPLAKLLRRIVETSRFAQPGQQSGVMRYVLPKAQYLPSRERCDLFLPLLSLCMKAYAQNGEAGEWLRKTMALLARLPEPLAMHAIEEALIHVAKDCAGMQTYMALVEALWGQATMLSAQPQAHLLLQLALCIGQIDGDPGARMLSALLAQADALDLPQANKTAWKLLYRAAAWHHDTGMRHSRQHRADILQEAGVLPEFLRRQVTSMLKAIDEAPYERKYRLPNAGWRWGWGCAIL